MEVRSDVTAGW